VVTVIQLSLVLGAVQSWLIPDIKQVETLDGTHDKENVSFHNL
jgi:hypothetical protein